MKNLHLLLLNKDSGGNERGLDAGEITREIESVFRQHGHEIESIIFSSADIEQTIQAAIKRRPYAILIAGGDGTVSTAAALMGGSEIALGVIPMGTFNLAARDFGVPLEIPAAAEYLATATVESVDVLDVDGRACLCTTILGFYPEFSHVFEKRDHGGHWWKKTLKLLFGLPRTYARSRPLHLEWQADDAAGFARTKFAALVPGSYLGKAGLVPARTDFQSGTMTAYVGHHKSASSALKAIFDYSLGKHEENAGVEIFKTSSLTLHMRGKSKCTIMLDGEILEMRLPLRLRILPRHLRVLASPEALFPPVS